MYKYNILDEMLQKILCGFFNIECIQKRFFDLWLVGCLWLLSVMVKFYVSAWLGYGAQLFGLRLV